MSTINNNNKSHPAKEEIVAFLEYAKSNHSDLLQSFVEDTPWQQDDDAWFAANESRLFRMRRRFKNEFPLADEVLTHVLVLKVIPGFSQRRLVTSLNEIQFDNIADNEVLLQSLWSNIRLASMASVLVQNALTPKNSTQNNATKGGM